MTPYTSTESIEVTDGQFHVLLGSRTTLNPADLSGDLYLGITVNGEEMLPREQLTSAVNAVNAQSAQGNFTMNANQIVDVAGIEYQDNFIYPATGGDPAIRLVSKNSVFVFLDSDDNSTTQVFKVLKNNSNLGSPAADVFRISESGRVTTYGTVDMNGFSITEAGNVYGAGTQQIHMPGGGSGSSNIYFNWHSGDSVHFGGGDGVADVSISSTGIDMRGNSVTNCGALVEANLQTSDELAADKIERFEEGDVLCWEVDRLEKCDNSNDALVQAVADVNGRPIVIGAEVVKVMGSVQYGDLLVASDVPGYAMVNNDPRPGSVIAQALEDFDGERGIIKAMIRKF